MESIDGYQVLKTLGEGGVGRVYLCKDPKLPRKVAVKVLTSSALTDRQLRRFEIEAASLARLRHPNVLTIYATGEDRGRPYLVLEYVAGRSLKERLNVEGYLPLKEAATLMAGVARAMHYVHGEGIIHRDIKPENVLLDGAGRALLSDFGLAKNYEAEESYGGTAPGAGLGTLGYMPPEQLDNAMNATTLSDVYGLGATFYSCLTGRIPFPGKTTRSVILRTLAGDYLPVAACRADGPPAAYDWVVARAMAVKAEDRYETAEALAEDLVRLARGEAVKAPPPRPKLKKPGPASGAIGALLSVPLEEEDAFAVPPSAETLETGVPTAETIEDGQRVNRLASEGEAFFRDGKIAESLDCFGKALAIAPDNVELLVRCAVARRKSGDHQGAIRDYGRLLELRPDDHRAYVGRGMARQDAKDFAGAVDDLRRALELIPATSSKRPRLEAALAAAQRRIGDSVIRGRNLRGE